MPNESLILRQSTVVALGLSLLGLSLLGLSCSKDAGLGISMDNGSPDSEDASIPADATDTSVDATDTPGDDTSDTVDASASDSSGGNSGGAPNASTSTNTPVESPEPSGPASGDTSGDAGSPSGDAGSPGGDVTAPATSDTPLACPAGSYDHDGDTTTACQAHTSCEAGTFVQEEGSGTSDRVCASCSPGSYSEMNNATVCSPWTECSWTELETQAPSASVDRGCGPGSEYRLFDNSVISLAIDGGDNLLIGTDPASVRKVDPNGREFGPEESDFPVAFGSYWEAFVAMDGQDNVLVAMFADNGSVLVSKFGPGGNELWAETIANPAPDIRSMVVAVDGQEHVLIAGTNALRPLLTKFDPEGNRVWTDPLEAGTPVAFARSVAVDSQDNVVVAGYTNGILPGIEGDFPGQLYVRKYDPNGARLWLVQFGTAGDYEEAHAVAVDSEDNILVAGFTAGDLQGTNAGEGDAFMRKVDPDGNEIWTQQFGTEADDKILALAVDDQGNLLVAGSTQGNLQGTNAGGSDAFVRKVDPDGNEIWTQQFGTEGNDSVYAVATDSQGRVFAAGYRSGEGPGFVRLLPEP